MTRKAAIIGIGHVGAHVASSLATQGIVDEILLLDLNTQKVTSEVQDPRDALLMTPYPVHIHAGDFADLRDVDVIIHAVGDIELLRKDHDRIDELRFNAPRARETARKIRDSQFHGIIINISNPCDVITAILAGETGLPEGAVFGTGTALDSSRLVSALSERCNISRKSITAYMMGEHGNRQFAPQSIASFAGEPIQKLAGDSLDWKALEKEAIGGGWVTFAGKFCTEYGVAATAARLTQAVLRDEHFITAVSARLNGEYGQKDVFAGVPSIIGQDGVERVLDMPLTKEELQEFASCCDAIRTNMAAARTL